ncbi:thioesterase family protein [Rheinheimera sp.]|uniref:thioesterase family protein n=1 Tax=Rheinheimera sp. TaxID=1869214 RepID=UPI003AF9A97C
MQFLQVMQQFSTAQSEQVQIEVPVGWGQGRALFGGMAAALAAQHLLNGPVSAAEIRSLTVSFVAPLEPGTATVSRRILRQGKSVTQALVEIEQHGQVALVLLASFGVARPSKLDLPLLPELQQNSISQHKGWQMPAAPGVPEFTQHIDFMLDAGAWPYSGGRQRVLAGRNRLKAHQGEAGLPELLALIDAWWPVSLGLLPQPAPASSLTWTLELLPGWTGFNGEQYWSYAAEIEQGADGYHLISSRLWNPAGALVGLSRQVVTVFA